MIKKIGILAIALVFSILGMNIYSPLVQTDQSLFLSIELVTVILLFMISVTFLLFVSVINRREFLLFGSGFLGLFVLEIFHLLEFCGVFQIQGYASFVYPWSEILNEVLLSSFFLLGWWQSIYFKYNPDKKRYSLVPLTVSFGFALFLIAIYLNYQFGSPYQQEAFFKKPLHFFPAVIYLMALVGFFKCYSNKKSFFEFSIYLFLFLRVLDQAFIASLTSQSNDVYQALSLLSEAMSLAALLIGVLIELKHQYVLQGSKRFLNDRPDREGQIEGLMKEKSLMLLRLKETEEELLLTKENNLRLQKQVENMIDRELRMIELKKEIKSLKRKLN